MAEKAAQAWERVHPNDVGMRIAALNAAGQRVVQIVSIEGSWSLGLLSEPMPGSEEVSRWSEPRTPSDSEGM